MGRPTGTKRVQTVKVETRKQRPEQIKTWQRSEGGIEGSKKTLVAAATPGKLEPDFLKQAVLPHRLESTTRLVIRLVPE